MKFTEAKLGQKLVPIHVQSRTQLAAEHVGADRPAEPSLGQPGRSAEQKNTPAGSAEGITVTPVKAITEAAGAATGKSGKAAELMSSTFQATE